MLSRGLAQEVFATPVGRCRGGWTQVGSSSGGAPTLLCGAGAFRGGCFTLSPAVEPRSTMCVLPAPTHSVLFQGGAPVLGRGPGELETPSGSTACEALRIRGAPHLMGCSLPA